MLRSSCKIVVLVKCNVSENNLFADCFYASRFCVLSFVFSDVVALLTEAPAVTTHASINIDIRSTQIKNDAFGNTDDEVKVPTAITSKRPCVTLGIVLPKVSIFLAFFAYKRHSNYNFAVFSLLFSVERMS